LTFVSYKIFYKMNDKKNDNQWEVALSPDYKPFCYLEDREVAGLDLEILKEIATIYNKKIVIKITGFNFLFPHMEQNKSHIGAGGLTITEERKKYNIISDSYLPLICGMLVRKNLVLNKDFKGKIGLQTGSVFKTIIQKKFPKAKIVEMEDFMFILENFKQNNVDVVVGDLIVLLDINHYDSLLFRLKSIDENNGTGFLLNKNINVKEFNEILSKVIKNNKKINQLKKKIKNIPTFE
jgi:ABC-type amino acid transport substrate-binding protein